MQPTSIFEIVTNGYKVALKTLWPVTRLVLPVAVLIGASNTVYVQAMAGVYESNSYAVGSMYQVLFQHLPFLLLGMGMMLYLNYVISRYQRDLYWDKPERGMRSYLMPDITLWWGLVIGTAYVASLVLILGGVLVVGMLGMFFLAMFAGLLMMSNQAAGMVVFVIGYLLLYLVFMQVFTAITVYFGTIYAAYMSHPEKGCGHAFAEGTRLVMKNMSRTVGLSGTVLLVSVAVMLPSMIFGFATSHLMKYNPSLVGSAGFLVSYFLVATAGNWFSGAISFAGFMSTMYRYYQDLKLRAGGMAEVVDMATYRDTQAAQQ